ncbi:MAG: glycoside hydrolase family 19 protein [Sphingomonadaceae bacterium]
MSLRRTIQSRIATTVDGIFGPATFTALIRYMGGADMASALGLAASRHLPAHGIDANPLRLTEWFGEMAHESQGFTRTVESLIYSSASRIRAVWPSRFRTDAAARPFVRQPEKLANHVYGGRLGNREAGDGWQFRGRGLVHLTGRANYADAGRALGLPLEDRPEMAADPDVAVRIACWYWMARDLNALADWGMSEHITRRINGGVHGLDDRERRKARFRRLWQ